jgi:hypothetical protein
MEDLRNDRQGTSGSGWTTTAAAAKALGISPRTVRLYLERGELEGRLEGGTEKRIWLVSIESLNTLRAKRGTSGIIPEREPEIADTVPEAMHDLAVRLEARAAEAAELRTRLELTEITQSSMEEEKQRLLDSLKQAEEQAETLRQQLEAERLKSFWQRLFGR